MVRLTITILCGTRAGQRFVVAGGDVLRVGRTAKADVVIADDPTMSAVHYELQCTDNEALVRDLQSRNGLFINGEPVVEAVLADDDQIRAGRTFFAVSVQGASKTSPCDDPDDETRASSPLDATQMTAAVPAIPTVSVPLAGTTAVPCGAGPTSQEREARTFKGSTIGLNLRERRSNRSDRLYAVIDGAVAQSLLQAAQRGELRSESLARAGSSPYLNAVAPYLIEVSHDCEFTALWHSMQTRSPGILIESQAEFDELAVHLRSIFCRRDELGRPSYFLFYDPDQLYAWLKTCNSPQVASFFGCLTSVVLPLDAGARVLRLTNSHEELAEEEVQAG
jgi:hypothetical protein